MASAEVAAVQFWREADSQLVAEFGLMLQLPRLSIREYLATRDPISGLVYYLMLVVFAFMPLLIGRG